MAELGRNLEKIEAARLLLKDSLEKSKEVSSALDETGVRLREINGRLPSLEAEVKPLLTRRNTCVAVRNQIECVIGPVAAVLRVYDAVCELDKSLFFSDPCDDLFAYVSVVRRLEEGLKFLSSNCELAIQWLEDIVQLLESNAVVGVTNDWCFLNLKKSSSILAQLRDMEGRSRLEGGLISVALDKLENEFGWLLTENTRPIPVESEAASSFTPMLLPLPVIQKLQTIIERLEANGRLEKCTSFFIDVRVLNAKTSLQALDLDFLDVQVTSEEDVQSVENYIKQWGKHLELAVKRVFKHEYKLCHAVFEKTHLDSIGVDCFASIATGSGILSFLRFGKSVTNMKKDPMKLLKLLDLFKVLNSLRLDFSQIFGNAACSEIQALTRDLVKKVVDGACGIFWELPAQVAFQRRFSSPPDGSVPRLVRFVTEYSNQLLGDDYRPALTEVLSIQRKWKQEVYDEGSLVSNQFHNIMKEIGLNLDGWSKAYADTSLSYLFMMNNHCHFRNLKGTKLGEIMGDSWLSAHEQYKDYYAALYLKESWGKILPLLSQKGLVSVPSSADRETGQDWDKKRLKAFNEAFEERYEKHSKWVITDESLRHNVCQLLVQTVVPAYRSYITSYKALVEQDASARKYVKHSAQSLENKLSSLFQPKLIKFCGSRHARLVGRIKYVVANRLRVTLTAM